MTKILQKGNHAVKIGQEAIMLWIVKWGSLQVTKWVQVPDNNYWPALNNDNDSPMWIK